MLNYANLNPEDFEALCRDIMERELTARQNEEAEKNHLPPPPPVTLRCFGSGKDGGIDILDNFSESMISVDPEDGTAHMDASGRIVIQAKHYLDSSVYDLLKTLRSELPKVEKLNPSQYYVCCSSSLLPQHVTKIFDIFKDYMASSANIVSQNEIEQFFSDPDNDDILRRHHKLWCSDPNVIRMLGTQDIFIDCQWLKRKITRCKDVFVETGDYRQAKAILDTHRMLFITGDPGTGKTMTSLMLTADYIARGYRIRYTTNDTDLSSLKCSLSADKDTKEVILLDDCLGQAYFQMKSTQSTELLSLIYYVSECPNKFLILNSRITILNEAKERQPELAECLEWQDLRIHQIDMGTTSEEDKAQILYSNLHHRGLSREYIDEIIKEDRYWEIIRHQNYNPRVLEFICTPSNFRDIPAEKYWDSVQKHLENPTEIWKIEYEDRLGAADRILLQTLYSLNPYGAYEEDVHRCFQHRIKDNPLIDKTVDPFPQALSRLSESMISIQYDDGRKHLSMINPSVNDFLRERLRPGSTEYEELVQHLCTPEQVNSLIPEEIHPQYISELLVSPVFDQFYFPDEDSKDSCIASWILFYKLIIPQCQSALLRALDRHPDLGSTFFDNRLFGFNDLNVLWDSYKLDVFYSEDNHLYRQLINSVITAHAFKLPSEIYISMHFPAVESSLIDIINQIYPLFRVEQKISIRSQIEHWLGDIQSLVQSIDLTNEEYFLIWDLYKDRKTSIFCNLSELAEPIACKIRQTICLGFQYAREHLPPEFQGLCYFDDPESIEILGLEKCLKDHERTFPEAMPEIAPSPDPSPLDIDALFHSPIDSTPDPC